MLDVSYVFISKKKLSRSQFYHILALYFPGVVSPTPMLVSPPPMLMPTPVQAQQQQQQQQQSLLMQAGANPSDPSAMAFTYVPVPVYNMGGVSIPGMAGMPPQTPQTPVSPGAAAQQQQQQQQQQGAAGTKSPAKSTGDGKSSAEPSAAEQVSHNSKSRILENCSFWLLLLNATAYINAKLFSSS